MAVTALLLYLVGVLLAFGLRSYLAWRRTGDTGFRRPDAPAFTAVWWGARSFVVALILALTAPLLGIAGVWQLPVAAPVAAIGLVLMAVGLALILISQTAMGASWRVGVDTTETTTLVTSGVFGVVRNPIFSAMGLLLVEMLLAVPSVVSVLALAAFIVGVQLQVRAVEEPYLRATHPDTYPEYAGRVGRFIPGLGRLEKRTTS